MQEENTKEILTTYSLPGMLDWPCGVERLPNGSPSWRQRAFFGERLLFSLKGEMPLVRLLLKTKN